TPSAIASAATESISASVRAAMPTDAPSRASARVAARPMPRPAPVTSATRPASRRVAGAPMAFEAGALQIRAVAAADVGHELFPAPRLAAELSERVARDRNRSAL